MATKSEMLAAATISDPRWDAVVTRDPRADGKLFYSVKTTGVYCRPSCAARSARPENVEFTQLPQKPSARAFAPASDVSRINFRWPSSTRKRSPSCAD